LGKSADAFRTIGEVANELDVPKHVLRFWEAKFSQVKPLKRGGGRRLYRPKDIDLLRGIRQLLYDARYTIIGVQQILRRDGVEFVNDYGRENELIEEAPESKEIPDLAKETAQEAYANSSVTRNGKKPVSQKKSAAVASALSPIHANLLDTAVKELNMCRKLLKQMTK